LILPISPSADVPARFRATRAHPRSSPAPRGALLLSCTGASVAEFRRQTLVSDDEQEPRSRLLLRRRERSPAPCSRSRSQPRLDESASRRPGPQGRVDARTGQLAPLVLRLIVHVIGCREMLRSCAGAVTHQPLATTRRPPLASGASSGHGDTGRRGLRAHPLWSGSSPARRIASRCRGGAGRWAIRWAEPRRIGPYQVRPRTLLTSPVYADVQVFPGLKARRTSCFARERTVVRNHPRPSPKRCD
jgi:hypothetical protein